MKYNKIKKGQFICRPNRFIAQVNIDGKEETCHVKNTGRCKELLTENATVILEESDNPNRRTKYDLVAVYKGDLLINMDSQAPNKVFYEWAKSYFKNITLIKPECKYKNSRFDFYIEADNKKIFAEIKGVTLEKDGVLMFPDAPTERGIKHLNELVDCVKNGYEGYIFFVIQMDRAKYFTPNVATHKQFADALKNAHKNGVKIVAVNCIVTENELKINDFVEVRL